MGADSAKMKVPSAALDRVFAEHKDEYLQTAAEIMASGVYAIGPALSSFEAAFADYIGVGSAVGVGCGLDSLWITLRLLGIGPGDEVIVQGNTFIATVMGITINGASPVFAEPDDYFGLDPLQLERLTTPRTKAVMVTHLYGMPARMDLISAFCSERGLLLVEDCAQAHGAVFQGKKTGSFGNAGCFSFYPTKNLGGFGDGGCIATDDSGLAQRARAFRIYGSEKKYHHTVVGANSVLDTLQAGLLQVRLQYLDEMNAEKRRLAKNYLAEIRNPAVLLPRTRPGAEPVWHQFVIRCEKRDALQAYLRGNGVDTIIHYPIPPHLSEAYHYLGYARGSLPKTELFADTVLSLPLFNGMTSTEQAYVIEKINAFRLGRCK